MKPMCPGCGTEDTCKDTCDYVSPICPKCGGTKAKCEGACDYSSEWVCGCGRRFAVDPQWNLINEGV